MEKMKKECAIVVAAIILMSVLTVLPVMSGGENVTNASDLGGGSLSELSEALTSGSWVGTTSEGENVSFNVSGMQVYNFSISYSYVCFSGSSGHGTFTLITPPLSILENKFQYNSFSFNDEVRIYGEFTSPNSATGTYSHTWTVHFPYFPYEDTCYTGNITWNASPAPSPLPAPTVVSIQDATANPGETVTVAINITNVENMATANIWLSYNKDVVTVESVSESDLSPITAAINNTAGVTRMNWFSATGKTGDFVFAYLTLKAVGSAGQSSSLDLDVKELGDMSANAISHTVEDGSFTISSVFDAGESVNPYPSIPGTHYGTITPNQTITVSSLYTYPCAGTGGHTEYAKIWNDTWSGEEAFWDGYQDNWHSIAFGDPFTLFADKEYYYEIRTGSYPQIHHTSALPTAKGWINCTGFVDVNGKEYSGWIPAIKLA